VGALPTSHGDSNGKQRRPRHGRIERHRTPDRTKPPGTRLPRSRGFEVSLEAPGAWRGDAVHRRGWRRGRRRHRRSRGRNGADGIGRLDLLVNNAGIFIAKRFTDYTADDYARLLATNLAGFFHMTQHALRLMEPGKSGHVVNISTSLASQPVAGVPSALPILIKGGIEAATRSLAIEYAAHGIRVNTIAPGIVDTPMHPKENHGFLQGLSPAGRIGTPLEIAEAVLYLESARFVSGEVIQVDGGAHAGKWA
jgi:NAD(P)-dependent dehydrogenase (short-subunit alcohol dehydrogenase family)